MSSPKRAEARRKKSLPDRAAEIKASLGQIEQAITHHQQQLNQLMAIREQNRGALAVLDQLLAEESDAAPEPTPEPSPAEPPPKSSPPRKPKP